MSEYILSDGITTLAVNLEDGSWRVVGTDSALGCKCFWFEWETGQLMTSALGHVFLLERPGEESDGAEPVTYMVETPARSFEAGMRGIIQCVYVDVNTRGEVLTGELVLDDGRVVPLPDVRIQTLEREVVRIPLEGVEAYTASVRLRGALLHRVDLFGIELDVSAGGA